MSEEENSLQAQDLKTYLKGAIECYVYDFVESTNEVAKALHKTRSVRAPFAVLAKCQTKGRGRHGAAWYSQSNKNLYLSLGLDGALSVEKLSLFTPWMSLKIADFLKRNYCISVAVKWPNDLILAFKKVGGVLVEGVFENQQLRKPVFGLGINLNSKAEDFPLVIRDKVTSLYSVTSNYFDINKFAADLITCVVSSYSEFKEGLDIRAFLSQWLDYDSLCDRLIKVFWGKNKIEGIAKGINEEGCLRLLKKDGSYLNLSDAKVSFSAPVGSKEGCN